MSIAASTAYIKSSIGARPMYRPSILSGVYEKKPLAIITLSNTAVNIRSAIKVSHHVFVGFVRCFLNTNNMPARNTMLRIKYVNAIGRSLYIA
jgi:hypothetical protein